MLNKFFLYQVKFLMEVIANKSLELLLKLSCTFYFKYADNFPSEEQTEKKVNSNMIEKL